MRPAVIIPAYNAEPTVGAVVRGLREAWERRPPQAQATPGEGELCIIGVDDGSTDRTAGVFESLGVVVVSHPVNRGKGAAIRTGLERAFELGYDVALTMDADGQHPPEHAVRVLLSGADRGALVLGVRDLVALGAPLPNRLGNGLANFSLTVLTLLRFRDTQCGLRRYPVESTLALRTRDDRFAFESEVLLRAARAALPIVELPVSCVYAPRASQPTHYRRIFDTIWIIVRMHVAYLYPWLRAPKTRARLLRPRVGVGVRVRQLGALWAGAVVLALVLLCLRAMFLSVVLIIVAPRVEPASLVLTTAP